MKKRKKLITALIIIAILLIVYVIGLFIPKTKTYSFEKELVLKNTYSAEQAIFGDRATVEIHFDNTSIYNTYYDEGFVIINGEKYTVKNSRHYPRSFIAKFKHELKYLPEMIKYEYDLFWFDIEHESGYTVTVVGHESGSDIHLDVKIDNTIYCTYEEIISE